MSEINLILFVCSDDGLHWIRVSSNSNSGIESDILWNKRSMFKLSIMYRKRKRKGKFLMSMMPKIWTVNEISIAIEMERG